MFRPIQIVTRLALQSAATPRGVPAFRLSIDTGHLHPFTAGQPTVRLMVLARPVSTNRKLLINQMNTLLWLFVVCASLYHLSIRYGISTTVGM